MLVPTNTKYIRVKVKQCTKTKRYTVKPLYYGHQGDRNKCPYYRGVRFREIGFICISVSQRLSELSVIERCPYYRGVRKKRFHCLTKLLNITDRVTM